MDKAKCSDCPFRVDCLTIPDCCLIETLAEWSIHLWNIGDLKDVLNPEYDDNPTPSVEARVQIINKYGQYLDHFQGKIVDVLAREVKKDFA